MIRLIKKLLIMIIWRQKQTLNTTKKKKKGKKMTKFNTLIKFKDGNVMYMRDHKVVFENAKNKGLKKPGKFMYMYSKDKRDFFKNINFRYYISFQQ